jgi:uncharacterized membrane protein
MNVGILPHSEDVNVGDAERLASIIGGGVLLAYGIGRRDWSGASLAAVGGMLAFRGITGHCHVYQAFGVHTAPRSGGVGVPYELGIRIDKSITINRRPDELYRFWRNLENLPRFMRNIESVEELSDTRSRWVALGPAGKRIEWEAEIVNEIEGELIGWRSLPGSRVESGGSVRFESTPSGRGTMVRVSLQYNPPGGHVGNMVAKLMGSNPSSQIENDLHRFKQLMETGEFITTEGQPRGEFSGKQEPAADRRFERVWSQDSVHEASEESFPASDAPSWTPGRL